MFVVFSLIPNVKEYIRLGVLCFEDLVDCQCDKVLPVHVWDRLIFLEGVAKRRATRVTDQIHD